MKKKSETSNSVAEGGASKKRHSLVQPVPPVSTNINAKYIIESDSSHLHILQAPLPRKESATESDNVDAASLDEDDGIERIASRGRISQVVYTYSHNFSIGA